VIYQIARESYNKEERLANLLRCDAVQEKKMKKHGITSEN